MENKEQTVESVSNQINSVIDNIASKMEGPTESIKELTFYGFEKTVEYAQINAIVISSIAFLTMITGIYFLIKSLNENFGKKLYWEEDSLATLKIVAVVVSIITIIVSISILGNHIPDIFVPEAAIIKGIISNIRQ